MTLQTPVTEEMTTEAFEFGTKYYQNPDKVTRSRTASLDRGLGAIIDANIVGKVIELGVNEILSKCVEKKKFFPDMEVRSQFEYGQPDVIEVEDNGKKRPPKCFVEVKNSPKNFLWVGLYTTQFNDMKTYVNGDEDNIYIIYASLRTKSGRLVEAEQDEEDSENSKENSRKQDLLGVYLKAKGAHGKLYDSFADISVFYVQIDYVITGSELAKNGKVFPANEPWASPEIFEEARSPFLKNGKLSSRFKKLKEMSSGKIFLPTEHVNNSITYPHQFGSLECSGTFSIFVESRKSNRKIDGVKTSVPLKTLFIFCKSDVVVKSNFLGQFNLDAEKVYRIKIRVKVASKDRDDLSYPKQNIDSIVKEDTLARMTELAKKL